MIIAKLLFIVGAFAGMTAVMGKLMQLIWNAAVAPTFHAPPLTFCAAWGIWVLLCLVAGLFRRASK